MLKALVERPEGAAAAVVVLQDRVAAQGHTHPALPRQVSVAIAEEFRKVLTTYYLLLTTTYYLLAIAEEFRKVHGVT